MGRFIRVYTLMIGAEFCAKEIALNCDKIVGQPRPVWVDRIRKGCCGGQGEIEYKVLYTDPNSGNELVGVLVDTEYGQYVLDAPTVEAITDACNACCDAAGGDVVTGTYNGTIPAFNENTASVFCVTRADDGGGYAVQKFNLDYMHKTESIRHVSNAAGVSKYRVTAYAKPKAVGADTVAAGECA